MSDFIKANAFIIFVLTVFIVLSLCVLADTLIKKAKGNTDEQEIEPIVRVIGTIALWVIMQIVISGLPF